jgi:hypothetical protein
MLMEDESGYYVNAPRNRLIEDEWGIITSRYFIFLIRIDPNHELIQIENGLYIRFYETPSNREA